jgi:integrase
MGVRPMCAPGRDFVARALTVAAVERFKPTGKRRWIRDAGAQSLYLVIQPSGHRSWVMRFRRPDGKPAKIVLGSVDLRGRELKGEPAIGQPLSLPAARQLAASIHRERALGQDVIADHKARRHRQRAELAERAEGTFGSLVRRFVEEHARTKTRRWRDSAMMLGLCYPRDGGEPAVNRHGLAERWADKPVRNIDAHDIHAAIDEAHRVAVPGVVPRNPGLSEARARGLYAALSAMFGWLLRHRWVDVNPCVHVWRPPPSKPRDRTLSPDEIRRLWRACDAIPVPYGAAVKLLLLLGARLNEVSGMERSELSTDGAVWTIPGSRAKNHRSCVVPLPPLAREIIASVPRTSERFVFSRNGHGPITGWSGAKHELDAAMGNPSPWTLHDLRRSAVTGMAELGIRPDVIELTVNHISGSRGGIAGTYNKSELMPERREALERWSRHVAGLVSPESTDKVVTLPRKRGR